MNRTPGPLPRNPTTHRLHRRDLVRQVYLPLGIVLVAVIALIVLTILAGLGVVGSPAGASVWADVSLIFIIVIALSMGLAPLIIFGGLAYGLGYALRYLPGYARVVQDFLVRLNYTVNEVADRIAKPVVAVESGSAAVGTAVRGLTERNDNHDLQTNGRTGRYRA
jgi:hypothetical protein